MMGVLKNQNWQLEFQGAPEEFAGNAAASKTEKRARTRPWELLCHAEDLRFYPEEGATEELKEE